MTASTIDRRSAYPSDVEDLLPAARKLTKKLGTLPSQRQLKTALKVGAPKAKAVRDALEQTAPETTAERAPETSRETDPDPIPEIETDPDAVPEPDPEATVETAPEITSPRITETAPSAPEPAPAVPVTEQATSVVGTVPSAARTVRTWPVLVLALPAFVAIWSGWVGLGGLTGFGVVHPLPGIADEVSLNTAITLPIGVETYAAYALRVWLTAGLPARARTFARWSAIGSLVLGAAGQVAFHLMTAAGMKHAPWQITTVVACLPVAVLGMGAALTHLLRTD